MPLGTDEQETGDRNSHIHSATTPCRMMLLASLIAIFLVNPPPAMPQTSQEQPNELTRRIVENELRAEDQDHSHWMFRLQTENKSGQLEVDEVVETKDGDLKYPILINGRELTATQERDSERRLAQVVKNPAALRKTLKDQSQDAARSQRLLKMLPEAFVFNYGERRGDLVQLTFRPNPHFHPNNREEQVFHAMAGSLWVDDKQARLAEIKGQLIEAVKFGGGLLGHLDQGGTFDVKQEPVAPGCWELTLLNVQIRGKALLFKTIAVKQKYFRFEFKRVQEGMTVAQGAAMLKKQITSRRMHGL
jgi:hypothetical protein